MTICMDFILVLIMQVKDIIPPQLCSRMISLQALEAVPQAVAPFPLESPKVY